MKKLIAIVCALLCVLPSFGLWTAAVGIEEEENFVPFEESPASPYSSIGLEVRNFAKNVLGKREPEFRQYIIDQVMSGHTSYIDIINFHIPGLYRRQLENYVENYFPELPDISIATVHNELEPIISMITVNMHIYDMETEKQRFSVCSAVADYLLRGINDSMSDLEKAIYVHEALCGWTCYNQDFYRTSTMISDDYSVYGLLVNREGVCEGYAKTYCFLARRAGLDCWYISSDAVYHAWNIVYIDGVPYHVDCTWDGGNFQLDPIDHRNMFMSTNECAVSHAGPGGEVDYDTTPSSETFRNAFWKQRDLVDGAFPYIDGKWYYIKNNTNEYWNNTYSILCSPGSTLADTEDDTEVLSFTSFSKVFFTDNGEDLFFITDNTMRQIRMYRFDVSEGTVSTAIPESELSDIVSYSLYGFGYEGGEFLFVSSSEPEEYVIRRIAVDNPLCPDGHTLRVMKEQKDATCITDGTTAQMLCIVCGLVTGNETIPSAGKHTLVHMDRKDPTCTEDGYAEHDRCTVCDWESDHIILYHSGHMISLGSQYCPECGFDNASVCDHLCHKDGFAGFFWKIINLFNKLFGINEYCSCGMRHW